MYWVNKMSDSINTPVSEDQDSISLLDLLLVFAENWKLLIGGSVCAGLFALLVTFIIPPTYIAKTTLIPPSLANSITNSGLRAELGGVMAGMGGGLAGLAGGIKNPGDQYVAYLESNIVRDELIQKFDLLKRYDQKYMEKARKELKERVKLVADKKSGLITIEVEDIEPQFAAQLANEHVEALSRLIGRMTIGEAKARRELLEDQVNDAMKKSYQSPFVREAVIQALIREYESARIDESRNHPFVIQVDPARPPELKSHPKIAIVAVLATIASFLVLLLFIFVRNAWRQTQEDSVARQKWARIQALVKRA